jgi:benzoyl-CoA reductase/2-hydroxyglutaryl-CoA dehydratase subunit BcrC/BadD/HgdB
MPFIMITLVSPNFFKSNRKCTYEFDIKEIDKFVDFIEDRFGEKLQLDTLNASPKRPNKIIVNDKLKSFVWEKFEKRFEKRNQLI